MRLMTAETLVAALASVFSGDEAESPRVLADLFADKALAGALVRAVSAAAVALDSGVPGDEVAADRALDILLDRLAVGHGPELLPEVAS